MSKWKTEELTQERVVQAREVIERLEEGSKKFRIFEERERLLTSELAGSCTQDLAALREFIDSVEVKPEVLLTTTQRSDSVEAIKQVYFLLVAGDPSEPISETERRFKKLLVNLRLSSFVPSRSLLDSWFQEWVDERR